MKLIYWLLGMPEAGSIAGASGWQFRAVSPLGDGWIALIVIGGLLAAALNFLPHTVAPWRTRIALALIRLAGFGLLLVLALQLEANLLVTRREKPVVAVLTDASGSMGLADVDGKTRLAAAREFEQHRLSKLEERARVVRFDFDWELRAAGAAGDPAGLTRLTHAIADAARREGDLRALVVLTDGNDTGGDRGQLLAPMLAARRLPVFPVVFGTTTAKGVARVQLAGGGGFVRLGDELRLNATLSTTDIPEQTIAVRLYEVGRKEALAARENLRVGSGPVAVAFAIRPEKAGRRTYRIVAEGIKGAISQQTLMAEREVDVIDARIKVLYVDIPRDERKILAHWLARDPVIDLATLTLLPKGGWYAQGNVLHKNVGEGLPNDEAELFRYDVVILGDIPRAYFREGGDLAETKLQRLVEFVGRRGGGLVTLGGRSVYAAGLYQDSALARVLPFALDVKEDAQIPKPFRLRVLPAGFSHAAMQLEGDPAANREAWLDLPTLDGSNRVGPAKAGASLLAVRDTESGPIPMIAVQNVGKGQVMSLAMDTTWRWEMMRPAEGEDYFRKFWGSAVRVLAPDPRVAPQQPQIVKYQSHPAVGQKLTLATRLVDDIFKPIQGAELLVKVTAPSGKITALYPRDGRQSPGLYEYDVVLDEPGAWEISTTYADKTAVERIVAGGTPEELDDPRARPEVMAEFAAATGGQSFTPDQGDALINSLNLAPNRVTRPATVALWNLPATMVLLILLVCVDCYLRKRRGMA
ncbi:membrane protein [Verrucomicrobiota bacterium]|nr:membrane protein [Verrucomicrobiota bacterium]